MEIQAVYLAGKGVRMAPPTMADADEPAGGVKDS